MSDKTSRRRFLKKLGAAVIVPTFPSLIFELAKEEEKIPVMPIANYTPQVSGSCVAECYEPRNVVDVDISGWDRYLEKNAEELHKLPRNRLV